MELARSVIAAILSVVICFLSCNFTMQTVQNHRVRMGFETRIFFETTNGAVAPSLKSASVTGALISYLREVDSLHGQILLSKKNLKIELSKSAEVRADTYVKVNGACGGATGLKFRNVDPKATALKAPSSVKLELKTCQDVLLDAKEGTCSIFPVSHWSKHRNSVSTGGAPLAALKEEVLAFLANVHNNGNAVDKTLAAAASENLAITGDGKISLVDVHKTRLSGSFGPLSCEETDIISIDHTANGEDGSGGPVERHWRSWVFESSSSSDRKFLNLIGTNWNELAVKVQAAASVSKGSAPALVGSYPEWISKL